MLENIFNLLNQRILLITAHPDDEVMFFSPLLISLKQTAIARNFGLFNYQPNNRKISSSKNLYILCLSTGNVDGLGNTRCQELIECTTIFDIPKDNIHIIDHALLQDGMNNKWSIDHISQIVLERIKVINPDIVRYL
eukprot:gene10350-13906_t